MRIVFKTIVIPLLFVNFLVFGNTGDKGIEPGKSLKSLTIDHWTGQDGLISNNLTSVSQSSNNFLWITSFNGIVRFDGVNFELYDKTNIPFLSSNGFYKTFEDSKGNLWFCSQSSGIIKYSNNTFEQVLPPGRNSLSVRTIAEDANGNLWIGTNNEGLYTYNNNVLEKVELNEFDLSHIMDVEIDNEGNIIIATNNDGLIKYKNGNITKIPTGKGLNHNALNTLFKAKDGTIFIGTLDGLFFMNDKGVGQFNQLKGIEINDLFIDDYENIWIAAEQGLYRLNPALDLIESFTSEDGLPGSQVSALCFDHENSLWLSTKKAGLVRLRDGFFTNLRVNEGLSSNNANIVVENGGKYYVGCDDGKINVVDGSSIKDYEIINKSFNLGIRDIAFTDNGEVLIASYRGLLRKNGRSEKLIDLNEFGSSNDIRRILKGKDGSIWLATRSSGVVKIAESNEVQIFDSSNSLKANYILALEENSEGDIFVGTHSGGLGIIRKNGIIENHPIEEGKSGILIFNIDLIDDESFWIATNIGIYKFENEVFRKVNLDRKLNAETIFDIVIIDNDAWLSSNTGLIRVGLSDIESYFNEEIKSVPGRIFDRFDGMASQECTGATRMLLSSDKKLWIPTLGGVAILDPDEVTVNDQVPNVFITNFLTDFQSRESKGSKQILVEPGVVRYEFKYTSLSYVAPPKVQFKYKLKGIDNEWVDAGTEREVVYTNLPYGNYTFSVISSNNDGVWNTEGASVSFRVKPHFYETTVFYLAMAAVLALLVWSIIRWRLQNVERTNSELRKLNEELDRFVYSASHDLRAPLSSVLGLVEIARLETTIEAKQQCLDMINTSVVKLDGFINDIIDYSRNQRIEIKPELLDIPLEVRETLNDLKYQDKENKIEKILEYDDDRKFVSDGRRLSVILKNIISNAIRYHNLEQSNPFIKISIKYETDFAIISISDNGIGIDQSHLENIFKMFYRADESSKGSGLGLYIVKETIDKLSGEITVESNLNSGTTFTFKIPNLKLAVA